MSLSLALRLHRRPSSSSHGVLVRCYAQSTNDAAALPLAVARPEPTDYDVAIIGGGVVGLALAAALGSRPSTSHLRTCLVEASDLSKIESWSLPPGEWSNRVKSVTNENRDWLKYLGVWHYVDHSRLGPIEEMQVWDALTPSRLTFTSPPPQHMSTLIEDLNLQRGLLKMIRERTPNVELIGGTRVEGIAREQGVGGVGEWPVVRMTGGKGLRARLIVGADGLRSPVRAFSGIESLGHSYNTHTIVSVLEHNPYPSPPTPRTLTAFQRFLPSGPLAFLPLSNDKASLAWHISPPELSAAVKALPEESLVLMINAGFRLPEHGIKHLLSCVLAAHQKDPSSPYSFQEILDTIALIETSTGTIEPHSPQSLIHPASPHGIPPRGHHLVPPLILSLQPKTTASFPLAYSHAASYVRPRVALVGDAAHTVHPHAGMGLNLGLADARSLAAHLDRAFAVGGDLGSMVSLKGYERERWIPNQAVLTATDGLEKAFRTENSVLRWVRSTGMDVLEELEGVKGLIMKESGGSPDGSKPRASTVAPTLASFVSTAVSTAESISAVASVVGSMAVRGVKAGIDGALHGGGKR